MKIHPNRVTYQICTPQFTTSGLEALNSAIDTVSGSKSRLRKDKQNKKAKEDTPNKGCEDDKIENSDLLLTRCEVAIYAHLLCWDVHRAH